VEQVFRFRDCLPTANLDGDYAPHTLVSHHGVYRLPLKWSHRDEIITWKERTFYEKAKQKTSSYNHTLLHRSDHCSGNTETGVSAADSPQKEG
jgi:hypothetical protein